MDLLSIRKSTSTMEYIPADVLEQQEYAKKKVSKPKKDISIEKSVHKQPAPRGDNIVSKREKTRLKDERRKLKQSTE